MKNPLIIEQPGLQSLVQRFGWGSITLFFWLFYLYLWLPLVTLVAWYAGYVIFDKHIVQLDGYSSFFELLKYYLLIIVLMGILLIGWAKIEHYRFSNKTTRKTPKNVDIEVVAQHYKIQLSTLTSLRAARVINVHFAKNGSISHFSEDKLPAVNDLKSSIE